MSANDCSRTSYAQTKAYSDIYNTCLRGLFIIVNIANPLKVAVARSDAARTKQLKGE